MSALVVTLPGLPPTLNHAYQGDGRGGRRLTKGAAAWMFGAVLAIRTAANAAEWCIPPRTPWRVTVVFTAPEVYTFDLDNLLKLLGDALHQALHRDDAPIDDRYITRWAASKVIGRDEQTWVSVEIAE